MAWIKIDTGLGNHRKAIELKEELYLPAIGLFVLMVAFSDQQRTDGFITRRSLARIARDEYQTALDELVRVGFLDEVEGGYQVHNYLEHQNSAAQIEAKSNAQRLKALARWNASGTASGTADQTGQDGDVDRDGDEHTDPDEAAHQAPAQASASREQIRDLHAICRHLTPLACEILINEFGFDCAVEAARTAKANESRGTNITAWPNYVRTIALELRPKGGW